ncbi:MAG: hypothetical protein ACJAZJ_000229 [Candidatus Endobugula sp.]|jgi:hypothetical protein
MLPNLKLLSLVVFVALTVSGCTTQLAPKYDAALFDGVTGINVNIMSLFASVSNGSESARCIQREEKYNFIIGSVDALAIQSDARPLPKNAVIKKVNAYLSSRGLSAINSDENSAPSAYALQQVSSQLVKMKQVDCQSGLTKNVVALFKNAVTTSMDQAITYESFLNR